MTLTVRTATVAGATTKGSALTHAEMDENWNHVANYIPSGTGATSRAVQTKLRELPSIEDYSSAGGVADQIQKALNANSGKTVIARSSSYNVDAPITPTAQFHLMGAGMSAVQFNRSFSGASASQGLFNLGPEANGSILEGMTIRTPVGVTGGCLISVVAKASNDTGLLVFRGLNLTTAGTDTHDYTVYIDGSAIATGSRSTTFSDCHIFGAAQRAV